MIRTFVALALTASLLSPAAALAQDATPQRYAVELQLMEGGKDVVLASTFVAVGGTATLTLNADKDTFDFSTNLYAQQGDGADDMLVTEVNLVRNGEEIAAPRMMMRRGGAARYEVGTEGADVVRVTIKPAP
ncbi:hypothetical protein [Brevundimonas sp.]|uniref:hypothetical protein n=1 Tax=Brevundimonas sp. TaxID=1871086 RepID=UPI00289A1DC1|nr:hypothetical protein [Brevundimonas sp.]